MSSISRFPPDPQPGAKNRDHTPAFKKQCLHFLDATTCSRKKYFSQAAAWFHKRSIFNGWMRTEVEKGRLLPPRPDELIGVEDGPCGGPNGRRLADVWAPSWGVA